MASIYIYRHVLYSVHFTMCRGYSTIYSIHCTFTPYITVYSALCTYTLFESCITKSILYYTYLYFIIAMSILICDETLSKVIKEQSLHLNNNECIDAMKEGYHGQSTESYSVIFGREEDS